MHKHIISVALCSMVALLVCGNPERASASSEEAVAQEKKEGKFQFLFFYEKGSDKSDRMGKVIKQAKDKWSHKASFRSIDINDSKERELIWKYGISRAPVTLVMAPNGVVVGGFPGVVGLDKLKQAFVSPKTIQIVGGLQQKKTIFLSIQNADTAYAQENTKAVNNIAEVLGKAVKIIEINPRDEQEASLLKQLKVKPDTTDSVTIVLAQGGVIVDRFDRKVTNKELFASFKKVLAQKSGCGSGPAGASGGGCR